MLSRKSSLKVFSVIGMMSLTMFTLSGCMTGSYLTTPLLPVLNEPPAADYRELGTISTHIDMRVGSATWRSIVNYQLTSQAQQKFGRDADAVILLNYVEGPRGAAGAGMAISYAPGPGMIRGDSAAKATIPKSSVSDAAETAVTGALAAAVTAAVDARQAQAVDDGLRNVILYREERTLNSGALYQVGWQNKPLGVLRNGSVLRLRLPPGSQTLTINKPHNKADVLEQPITVADSGDTYLLVKMKFSISDSPRKEISIEPVSSVAGRIAVNSLGL